MTKPTLKLYEISNEYQQALDALSEIDGVDDETIENTIEGLEGEVKDKAVNVALYIKTLEAEAAAIFEQEKILRDRRQSIVNKQESLHNYLFQHLSNCGIDNVNSPLVSIRIAKNPPSVGIIDAGLLDEKLLVKTISVSPDKNAIKKILMSGEDCPGAELLQSNRLAIK